MFKSKNNNNSGKRRGREWKILKHERDREKEKKSVYPGCQIRGLPVYEFFLFFKSDFFEIFP